MGYADSPFPLAETVKWRGKRLPRYGWYMISGAICDVGQFIVYKVLCTSLEAPTFSWTAAYVASIAMRQESHRIFVFGSYEGAWWRNLWSFYCVYFVTVATSMPVNKGLVYALSWLPEDVERFGIARTTYAYFATMIYTGVFSYVRLKANWRRPSSSMKLSKSGLDLGVLPTTATKASAINRWAASRRGSALPPEGRNGAGKHRRVPSYGSEYSRLLSI